MLFHLWYPVKEIIEQLKGAKITLIGTATTVDETVQMSMQVWIL